MNLVLLYGAEAVGKYTVGRELARITDLRLFPNHVTLNAALHFYSFDEAELFDLSWKLRFSAIEFALCHNVPGVILTWAYARPHSVRHWSALMEFCATRSIRLLPVHLHCTRAELLKRVDAPRRAASGKISSPAQLQRFLDDHDYAELPGIFSLDIDNTKVEAGAAARIICDAYVLSGECR